MPCPDCGRDVALGERREHMDSSWCRVCVDCRACILCGFCGCERWKCFECPGSVYFPTPEAREAHLAEAHP